MKVLNVWFFLKFQQLSDEKYSMANSYVPVQYLKPHYSTKMWKAHYRYICQFYEKSMFDDICNELKMPVHFLLSDDNWVSNEFLSDYILKVKEKTGDPNVAENIGVFTLTPEALNPLEYYLIRSMPPYMNFLMVATIKDKLNQITNTTVEIKKPGHFEFSTLPSGSDKPHPCVCDNTVGILKSAGQFYNLDFVNASHPECIHNGGSKCRFVIEYSAFGYWRRAVISSLVYLGPLAILFSFVFGWKTSTWFQSIDPRLPIAAVGSLFILTVIAFRRYHALFKYNSLYHEQSRRKNLELYNKNLKLNRRYSESQLLKNLCADLVGASSESKVIQQCVDEIVSRFGYGRVMAMLLSADQQHLYTADARGFGQETKKLFGLKLSYPGNPSSSLFFASVLKEGKSQIITDISSYASRLKPENRSLLENLDVTSLIVCPIQDNDLKFGLIVIGSIKADSQLTEEDLFLIENITNVLALFFKNALNFHKEQTLRRVFQKYVPKSVMDSLSTLSTGHGSLDPKTAEITSMFIDLRGFTSFSEKLPPERVVGVINKYIEFVSKRISDQGGIIDNLMGDGVVAFFIGNQTESGNHAERAFSAATSIVNEWNKFNIQMQELGLGALGIGIGMHTGKAVVGDVGSEIRTNYTAIGDTVNLAARLQDLSKKYMAPELVSKAGNIICSEATKSHAHLAELVTDLGLVEVRGKAQKVRVFMIMGKSASSSRDKSDEAA